MLNLNLVKTPLILENIRVGATSQDPQDVAARLHETLDRVDEAFEVNLVYQRLAVRQASNV